MKFEGYGPKWNKCEFCHQKLELPRKPKIGDRLRHSEKQLDKHDDVIRWRIKGIGKALSIVRGRSLQRS